MVSLYDTFMLYQSVPLLNIHVRCFQSSKQNFSHSGDFYTSSSLLKSGYFFTLGYVMTLQV